MAATLQIYVLLYHYYSPHIDHTLLWISVEKQQTAIFISHVIAICVPSTIYPSNYAIYNTYIHADSCMPDTGIEPDIHSCLPT